MELDTRPQLIKTAKKLAKDSSRLEREDDLAGAAWTQGQAKVLALIAIADALDGLIRNGLMVERP